MTLGDLSRGGSPDGDRNRKLGMLAGVAMVALAVIGVLSLFGDDGESAVGDATTTSEGPTEQTEADGDDGATDTTAAEGTDEAPADEPGTTAARDGDDDGFTYGTGACPPPSKPPERVLRFADAPRKCITDGVDYGAVLTTNLGAITIDLLEDEAPGTVNNFVVLARYGYYDGFTFHRVITEYIAQGGDPVGTPPGFGDPGYTIPDELPDRGDYDIGSVAMANQYDAETGRGRDTGGSQFFIFTGTNALLLPPDYALFGKVTGGVDVVDEIDRRGSQSGTPAETVLVSTVEIVER